MITISWRGTTYQVPEPDDAFSQSLTNYLVAVASGAVPLPTTADSDFGALFGVAALYFRSKSTNPAASGVVRLAAGDGLAFRNAANAGDVLLGKDAGDALTFGGQNVTGNPMLAATTAAGQSIPSATTTIVVFGTVERDSDSAYNASTGRFTVPAGKGGDYAISSAIMWATSPTPNGTLSIYKNGAVVREVAPQTAAASDTYGIACILNLAAGDILDVRVTQGSGAPVALTATAVRNFFSLKRIPT